MGIMQTIYPILRYRDARRAIEWLCETFGFVEVFSVPETGPVVRHAQLRFGTNRTMLGSVRPDEGLTSPEDAGVATQALYVIVEDVDAHYERARAGGAKMTSPPTETGFGSRDYHARDPEGHHWVFGTFNPGADLDSDAGG